MRDYGRDDDLTQHRKPSDVVEPREERGSEGEKADDEGAGLRPDIPYPPPGVLFDGWSRERDELERLGQQSPIYLVFESTVWI